MEALPEIRTPGKVHFFKGLCSVKIDLTSAGSTHAEKGLLPCSMGQFMRLISTSDKTPDSRVFL
jgi:hypothetical protein